MKCFSLLLCVFYIRSRCAALSAVRMGPAKRKAFSRRIACFVAGCRAKMQWCAVILVASLLASSTAELVLVHLVRALALLIAFFSAQF